MSDRPTIDIVADPSTGPVGATAARWLARQIPIVAPHLPRRVARCALRVVGDGEMGALHLAALGIPGPTDVLTFDSTPPAPGSAIDVDIAVCIDEAARSVQGGTVSVEEELLLYAVHGLLHCAGFDDVTPEGAAAMHAEEDRILTAVGVGPIFTRGQMP